MFQAHLDRVIAWATAPQWQAELLRAKARYFEQAGEPFEDDRSFEPRMAAFLEFFLFDHPLEPLGVTPVAGYLAQHKESLASDELPVFEGFTRTLHGVFEVKKLNTKLGLKIRQLPGETDFEVFERRGIVGVEKGDVLEARLIPFDDHLIFSGTFLYHPREARKAILKESKRRKKLEPEASSRDFAWELSRMALKQERYRNAQPGNIYRFG